MADLQWAIINKHNSFMLKNRLGGRTIFSKEANNLTNLHSFKFSGLVNSKAVGIVGDGKYGVVVSQKTRAGANQPKNAFRKVTLKSGARPTLATVKAITAGANPDYRTDLVKFALARATAVLLSQKKKGFKVKKGRKAKKVRKAVKKVAPKAK